MSIALQIEDPKNESERYLPIAVESAFEQYWRPGCFALKLKWIPAFKTGLVLRAEDIPEIIDELTRLDLWMKESFDPKTSEHLHERIDPLIRRLGDLERRPGMKASIG